MFPAVTGRRARFVVCEDGTEYIERFRRFLGEDFEFVPAGDFASALEAAAAADGLLLDLDFRRTPPGRLVDERGAAAAAPQGGDGTRQRLAESQGIFILRALRARAVKLPAVLFADLDDVEQARILERTLAPVVIMSSRAGLRELGGLLRGAPPGPRS
jgi:hypothetical protein